MKFMKKLFKLNLLLLLLAFNSCSDDIQNTVSDPDDIIDIGTYTLKESSINKIPYLGKKHIIFLDSFNHKVKFDIIEKNILFINSILYRYDVHKVGDTVQYSSVNETKTFIIKNDSLGIQFDLRLEASPYHADPESKNIADVVNIFCLDPDPNIYASQVFYTVLDQRTWLKSYNTIPIDEMDFLGRKFQLVLTNNFMDPLSIMFFNYQYGIISFTDFDGKIWRFEEMN